jgi:gluconokinase
MIIVLMGVTGSGKTTVGKDLAKALNCPFYDSDDFHSSETKEKMARGIGLTDEDRKPWLDQLAERMKTWNIESPRTVLACSALKQKYRDQLGRAAPVEWVYLKGSSEVIRQRLDQRQGHYAGAALLESQLEVLEEPRKALVLDISESVESLVLGLLGHFRS